MESAEHQEWRSRQHLNAWAAFKTAFAIGLIFFFMSGGTPWSTAGTMDKIMGRDFPLGLWSLFFGHMAVSIIYTYIIAGITYRFPTLAAVPLGVVIGFGLYLLNKLIVLSAGLTMHSPEFVAFFVHILFAFFVALIYKAISVPPPLAEQR